MGFSIARRALLVLLVSALWGALSVSSALATVTPAWAGFGSTPGWYDWSVVSTLPGNVGATSPHGGYSTATAKCRVCHSVHAAGTVLGSELLLPSAVRDSCAYCHMNGAVGYTQVYSGDPANYSGTNLPNAHNTWEVAGIQQGVTCTMCHQVHGAANQMTVNAFLTQRILRSPVEWDPNAGVVLAGDSREIALTRWCAACHFSLPPGSSFVATGYNQPTHPMQPAAANWANPEAGFTGRIAWRDSTYCMSCHASDYLVPGGWPHMTAGVRFLVSATSSVGVTMPASVPVQDGICLRCHRDTGAGVGLTY